MCTRAPLSQRGAKVVLEALDRGELEQRAADIAAVQEAAVNSEDYREARQAFLEAHPDVQGAIALDAQFQPLDPAKFRDRFVTAKGEARAQVPLRALETLWFNTGTLCNLTCRNCYIEVLAAQRPAGLSDARRRSANIWTRSRATDCRRG